MDRKKIIAVVAGAALLVAVAFGAVAYRSATAAAAARAAYNRPMFNGFPMNGLKEGGMPGGYSSQDLATALGITTDQLNTAVQKADSDAIDQAVKAGLITQAQADQLKSSGHAFPMGERWMGWLSQNGIDYNALLASALGISADKLQTAYKQAYNARIDQLVTNGRLTQEQADQMKGMYALQNDSSFQTTMQNAFKDAVNAAVSAGVITQAQADAILKNQANQGFPFFGGFHGFGERGGFGGHGHGRGGFGPQRNWGGSSANPGAPMTPQTTPQGSTGL